jgi:SAM-dependent methyltransferase
MNMQNGLDFGAVFEDIYSKNLWRYGSGEGSLPEHTKPYRMTLQKLLTKFKISGVVDLGCGDWQFSRLIDWTGIDYHGFDVVRSVIEEDRRQYSSENIHFHLYPGLPSDLPGGDLLIAKDVLQHWSDEVIMNFLPHIRRYKYCLITNCINPNGHTVNANIQNGGFRYLDLRLAPFNLHAEELLTFTNYMSIWSRVVRKARWRKVVLLVSTARAAQQA